MSVTRAARVCRRPLSSERDEGARSDDCAERRGAAWVVETLSPDGAEERSPRPPSVAPPQPLTRWAGGSHWSWCRGMASVAAADWTSGSSGWPSDAGCCHRRLRARGRGDAGPPALGGESGVLPSPSPRSCLPGEGLPGGARPPASPSRFCLSAQHSAFQSQILPVSRREVLISGALSRTSSQMLWGPAGLRFRPSCQDGFLQPAPNRGVCPSHQPPEWSG